MHNLSIIMCIILCIIDWLSICADCACLSGKEGLLNNDTLKYCVLWTCSPNNPFLILCIMCIVLCIIYPHYVYYVCCAITECIMSVVHYWLCFVLIFSSGEKTGKGRVWNPTERGNHKSINWGIHTTCFDNLLNQFYQSTNVFFNSFCHLV